MRVAYVVSSYQPRVGGVEAHVQRLAEGCARAGDEVTVLTHQVDAACADEMIGAIRVLRFPLTSSAHNYPLSLDMFRYLRAHAADFDLAHAHSYHTLVGHAAIRTSLPTVFTPHYHGTGHTTFRAFLHKLYKPVGGKVFRSADAVVCVSEFERGLVIKDFPSVTNKVCVILNGTEFEKYTISASDATARQPIVLVAGRLERYKNIDLIIQAFRGLLSEARLIVVGDGPDRPRLERIAKSNESHYPVEFAGRISDAAITALFAQCRVVVSASDHEAFGLTVAEGLAAGARVVASNIPAHVEIAQLAGASAPIALVDPRDTRRFTEAIAAALPEDRPKLQDIKLPSWADVVSDTRELYARVLQANARSAYRKVSGDELMKVSSSSGVHDQKSEQQ